MPRLFSASKILLVAAFTLLAVNVSFAQEDDAPPSRSITSLDFQTQRPKTSPVSAFSTPTAPKSAKRRKNIAALGSAKRRYKLVIRVPSTRRSNTVSRKQKTKPVLVETKLGVTFWRLRPAKSDEDDAPTFPVETGSRREYWTAERVDSTTKFKNGDRVRFTIESPRTGYLYVINREFYTDGAFAEAALIFPTLKTRGGDNLVTGGTLIEIPPNNDVQSYFGIEQHRKDYAGEELFVIISPTKLSNIKIGLRAQSVPDKVLNKWLDDWSATVDVYDAEDGEGIAYTDTEAEAVTVKTRSLRLAEPSPQTIYRVRVPKNQPLLVPFRLNASPK